MSVLNFMLPPIQQTPHQQMNVCIRATLAQQVTTQPLLSRVLHVKSEHTGTYQCQLVLQRVILMDSVLLLLT